MILSGCSRLCFTSGIEEKRRCSLRTPARRTRRRGTMLERCCRACLDCPCSGRLLGPPRSANSLLQHHWKQARPRSRAPRPSHEACRLRQRRTRFHCAWLFRSRFLHPSPGAWCRAGHGLQTAAYPPWLRTLRRSEGWQEPGTAAAAEKRQRKIRAWNDDQPTMLRNSHLFEHKSAAKSPDRRLR